MIPNLDRLEGFPCGLSASHRATKRTYANARCVVRGYTIEVLRPTSSQLLEPVKGQKNTRPVDLEGLAL